MQMVNRLHIFYSLYNNLAAIHKFKMSINKEKYREILAELNGKATLVAVSKTKSIEDIQALYDLGHRDFARKLTRAPPPAPSAVEGKTSPHGAQTRMAAAMNRMTASRTRSAFRTDDAG